MRHTNFSVQPKLLETEDEQKFYQTRQFKLLVGLSIMLTILLAFFDFNSAFNCSEAAEVRSPSLKAKSVAASAPSPAEPPVLEGSNRSKKAPAIPSIVPSLLESTRSKSGYRLLLRNRKVMFAMVFVAAALLAFVVALTVYLRELRMSEELEAEQKRLEVEQQALEEVESNEETKDPPLDVLRVVIILYGFSLLITVISLFVYLKRKPLTAHVIMGVVVSFLFLQPYFLLVAISFEIVMNFAVTRYRNVIEPRSVSKVFWLLLARVSRILLVAFSIASLPILMIIELNSGNPSWSRFFKRVFSPYLPI